MTNHKLFHLSLAVLLLCLAAPAPVMAQSSGVKYLSGITPTDKHAATLVPGDEAKTFNLGGVTYSHGFYLRTTQGPTRHGFVQFSLKGAYKTFNFILGTSPQKTNLTKKGIFAIYLDGRKAVDKIVDPHGVPERMSLDVTGVDVIRFEIIDGEVYVGIAEPTLWTDSQTPRELEDITPLKGDKPVKLTTDIRPYQQGPKHSTVVKDPVFSDHEVKSVSLNSKTYDNGLLLQANMGVTDNNLCTTHFNLGGKFSKLSLLYGPADSGQGTLGKGWFAVRSDGKLIAELEVGEGDVAKREVLDVNGCHELTFETENESGSLSIAAVEITAYPEGFEPEASQSGAVAASAEATKWPDVCKLMSTIAPYAVGGGITRENGVFDGKSEHITFSMGGEKFSEGLILRASTDVLNDNTHSHAIFNLENQFDYISFTNGWISKCGVLKNDTLRVYADDKIVFEMPQVATSPNKRYEVPVNKCAKLMFELQGKSSLTHPAFGVGDIVAYRGKPVENDLFSHPAPELPDQADLIDLGAPYVHYVPTMKDWPEKIFYDGSTQRKYFENGGERINKGFMLQTSVHFDLEMGPGSDPGVGVMAAGMGASMMVGTVGGMTISAVFPFGCLLALASGGTAMESSCAAFNTYGAYDYVTFTVASLNPSTTNRKETLIIGGDGQAITELEVSEQMSPRTFTVPIGRCSQLMFWLQCGKDTSGKYIFYDLRLGKGEAPDAVVPVVSAAQTVNTPSVAASPDPYILPVAMAEVPGSDWQKPSATNSTYINTYFSECHTLKVDIEKYIAALRTDYKTVASAVKSASGDSYREITLVGSGSDKFSFSELLSYDKQVLADVKSFKIRFATLALSQTTAFADLSKTGSDIIKCTKLLKQAGTMVSTLKKQLDALEDAKQSETELLGQLIASGLTVDGTASDDSRIFIR